MPCVAPEVRNSSGQGVHPSIRYSPSRLLFIMLLEHRYLLRCNELEGHPDLGVDRLAFDHFYGRLQSCGRLGFRVLKHRGCQHSTFDRRQAIRQAVNAYNCNFPFALPACCNAMAAPMAISSLLATMASKVLPASSQLLVRSIPLLRCHSAVCCSTIVMPG